MLHNKLLRVVQAHLLGFSTGSMFSGNAFACSACFIRLFSSSVAWSNWSIPNFPTESFIVHIADLSAWGAHRRAIGR